MPVGEGDQRLHPTAVVPRQPTTRHTTGQAAVQNRAALAAVRTLQVLTGLGGARHRGRRHLLGVAHDDDRPPPPHGANRAGHRDLRGLIEDDHINITTIGREETRRRIRRNQQARSDRNHEIPVGIDQAPNIQSPPTAIELAAQLLGARTGLPQHPIAMGQNAAQQLGRQRLAQPPQGVTVILEQPSMDGRIEGIQPGLPSPGLESGLGPLEPIALGVALLDQLPTRPVIGRTIPRIMQPLPVLPQTPAKLSQPPAQLVHLGSADVGGLQVERAPQRLADLGGLHAVVVKVEQQVADARLLAQSAGDDIEGRGLLRHEHDGPPLR